MCLIARTHDHVGHRDFPKYVSDLCMGAADIDDIFVCEFFKNGRPCQVYDNLDEGDFESTVEPYLRYAWLRDPFYAAFRKNVGDRVVLLKECAPRDFHSTEYYRAFYSKTGLLDECAVFVSLGPESSIVFSLGKRDERVELGALTKRSLETLMPVLSSFCRRHWTRPEPPAGAGRFEDRIESALDAFGSSRLSAREAEIARLILKGHSSKSIGRMLGNSPGTVKVHRKHIYAKMNVASQGELFSLFLQELAGTRL